MPTPVRNLLLSACLALAAPAAAAPASQPWAMDPEASAVMQRPAPPLQRYAARDGAALAYRSFAPPADGATHDTVVILLHGSGGSSRNMTVLGEALARAGLPAFALDMRGQGQSGRRGDVDYIGQHDDDLADFLPVARRNYPGSRLVLVGHSAGGGFVLRVAGEPLGREFSRFVLLAPVLGRLAPTNRPDAGWARPDIATISLLTPLNAIGVTAFNGGRAVDFNLPPGAAVLGLTPSWSFRMMMSYGPSGQTQLFGRPGYWRDAQRAVSPIAVVAGAADEQFFADRYAVAFAGLARAVEVELAPGVSHMGVLSDPRAVPLIVAAVQKRP